MLKKVSALALASALAMSTVGVAFADDAQQQGTQQQVAQQQGALAPGKAATVKQAKWIFVNGHWVWIVGTAFLATGLGLAASGGGNGVTATSTTTTVH